MTVLFTPWRARTLGLLLGACAISTSVQAIVVRHDGADADYLALGNNYSAVGRLATASGFGFCTGTLVAANKVLTASHCVTNTFTGLPTVNAADVFFRFGPDGSAPTSIVSVSAIARNHGVGDWSYERDMAVLTLSSDVLGIPFMSVNPFINPVTQTGTMVGYGATGTGTNGGGLPNNLRRGAHNVVDFLGVWDPFTPLLDMADQFLLYADFDSPNANQPTSTFGSTSPLALEGITDAGDSGGPMIVGDAIVGTLFGGFNPFDGYSGREFYGDLSIYASVQLKENISFLREQGVSFVPQAVPLPSSVSLLGIGLAALGWRSRRRVSSPASRALAA